MLRSGVKILAATWSCFVLQSLLCRTSYLPALGEEIYAVKPEFLLLKLHILDGRNHIRLALEVKLLREIAAKVLEEFLNLRTILGNTWID